MIPFVDLKAQYRSIKPEIDQAVARTLEDTAFIGGERVSTFEEDFAHFCGSRGCVGVGNGTDALYLALRALGVGPGDEVITVSHTFAATLEAILMCGADPVLVDISEETMLMDPDLLEAAVTERTKAVVPVHLYGQLCDMEPINKVAERHSLQVVEDAAQAHGATRGDYRAGTCGKLAAFSFYPGKNLGAYGDAGAVTGDNEELLFEIRRLANHGRRSKYEHDVPGVNSRLDALQAAVLGVKLPHLKGWTESRRRVASVYMKHLRDLPLKLPTVAEHSRPVWHLFVIRTPQWRELGEFLKSRGVETGRHYPVPCHLQAAFAALGYQKGEFPVTEKAAEDLLSLPIFAEMRSDQQDQVISAIREFFGS